MSRLFLLFLICVICCKTTFAQQTPIEFNDHIAALTDSLYARGQAWGYKFNDAVKSKDFTILAGPRRELQVFIDKSIKELQNAKDVKGSEKLRHAMIDFLTMEKSMIANAFIPVEKLTANATDAEVQAALDRLTEESKKETADLQKLNAAQKEYAAKNNFSIEPAK
ncbi:MAG: hypothetical protein JSS96_04450 [Bacteroidetes bacterium]|nr:hypothetical protein [Bacteroidota bacterium]